MNKGEFIKQYDEMAYKRKLEQEHRRYRENHKKILEQRRLWREANRDKVKELNRKWNEANPEKVEGHNRDQSRKGGSRYNKKLEYKRTGLPGERNRVRSKHNHKWSQYKRIIAPDSQLHHQWSPQSASYDGLAIVEVDAHMHGVVDVIEILEGTINIFTEAELQRGVR